MAKRKDSIHSYLCRNSNWREERLALSIERLALEYLIFIFNNIFNSWVLWIFVKRWKENRSIIRIRGTTIFLTISTPSPPFYLIPASPSSILLISTPRCSVNMNIYLCTWKNRRQSAVQWRFSISSTPLFRYRSP